MDVVVFVFDTSPLYNNFSTAWRYPHFEHDSRVAKETKFHFWFLASAGAGKLNNLQIQFHFRCCLFVFHILQSNKLQAKKKGGDGGKTNVVSNV